MSENENLNPLAIINKNVPAADAQKVEAMLDTTIEMNWIPSLAICYATSDAFEKGIAKPGEFVLAGQTTLGSTIQVVPIDVRLHAIIWDKDENKFAGEIFHLSNDPRDVKDNPEYQAFINQNVLAHQEIQKGSDIFVYIPDQNAFASFFCKKSLAQAAGNIWKAGAGGRLLELTTHGEKTKRGSWFSIEIKPLDRAVAGSNVEVTNKDIGLPVDKFNQFYSIFVNPQKGVEVTGNSVTERAR